MSGTSAGAGEFARVIRNDGAPGGTLVDRVADAIRADIADGRLMPGDRLLPDFELAVQHSVARATVRVALALLEASGVVEARSGRRYVSGGRRPDLTYERIADDIRTAIAAGRHPDGRRLPGENSIAASYGASRPTARKALEALQSEGLVYRVPRRGWFVAAASTDGTPS